MKARKGGGLKNTPYQNKCPHMLTTASLAVSRHILHSNAAFCSPPLAPEDDPSAPSLEDEAVALILLRAWTKLCRIICVMACQLHETEYLLGLLCSQHNIR